MMTKERRLSRASKIRLLSAFLWSLVALATGCGHTKAVEPPVAPDEKSASDAPPVHHKIVTSDLKGPDGERQNISISTSPAALLKPGAAKSIQEKLSRNGELHGDVSSGLDGQTQDALKKFQREHDLPATGIPDDATVRKLGLKPENVFRTGTESGAP